MPVIHKRNDKIEMMNVSKKEILTLVSLPLWSTLTLHFFIKAAKDQNPAAFDLCIQAFSQERLVT